MQPILKIDLTTGAFSEIPIPTEWVHDYLGAASLAARLLYDELLPDRDALDPDAPLLFLNGPLTGSAGPAVGRFVICARSPATGLWGESNIGGFWGPELRKAGFDGLWLSGRAETSTYLWIQDQHIEMRSAAGLQGLDCYETQAAVLAKTGRPNTRVACIGPAGEAQLPYALILTDHGRVAGRTGMGAVMGSKNLKAVAVKGTGQVPLIDWEAYKPLRGRANRALREHNQTLALRQLGTAASSDYFDYLGEMPKRYFSSGVFEGAYNVSGSSMAETILTGVSACHACVIACGRVVQLADGQKRKGPEYETLVGFGPNLMIDDIAAITQMGERCDRLGVDTISMSNTIGLAFWLFERGKIDLNDTRGLDLSWGNTEAALALIDLTVAREGLGAYLALGAAGLAQHFGAPGAAVEVNGLEVAYHDPRGASGMALVYATSPRGACHNQSDYFLVDIGHIEEELGITFQERQAGPEKAANVARHQDWRTVANALVICTFANVPPLDQLALVNAALGSDLSLDDLLRSGERAWNLKRIINHRLGLTRSDDRLPDALLRPYLDGGAAGYVPPLDEMLAAYYQVRGWDPDTGRPTAETLNTLSLDWAVMELVQ
jgi:aldehyde:ferredoxin oxidoreductase